MWIRFAICISNRHHYCTGRAVTTAMLYSTATERGTHHTWVREDMHCSNGCHFSLTRCIHHDYKTKYQICRTNTQNNPLTHSLLIFQPMRTSATVCHKQSLKYLILPDVVTPISRRKLKHFSVKKKKKKKYQKLKNPIVQAPLVSKIGGLKLLVVSQYAAKLNLEHSKKPGWLQVSPINQQEREKVSSGW